MSLYSVLVDRQSTPGTNTTNNPRHFTHLVARVRVLGRRESHVGLTRRPGALVPTSHGALRIKVPSLPPRRLPCQGHLAPQDALVVGLRQRVRLLKREVAGGCDLYLSRDPYTLAQKPPSKLLLTHLSMREAPPGLQRRLPLAPRRTPLLPLAPGPPGVGRGPSEAPQVHGRRHCECGVRVGGVRLGSHLWGVREAQPNGCTYRPAPAPSPPRAPPPARRSPGPSHRGAGPSATGTPFLGLLAGLLRRLSLSLKNGVWGVVRRN